MNDEVCSTKEKLRADLRARYRAAEMNAYVDDAVRQIAGLDAIKKATHMLAYIPISVLEIPFMTRLMHLYPEKQWFMPEVVGEGEMIFTSENIYRLNKNTCVLVPSLALDQHGGRLGKGGGYYDRFLAIHPSLVEKTVSIIPDFARLDSVPTLIHDVSIAYPLFASA